jgi:hypothetical protein
MNSEPKIIPVGWSALASESKCFVLREFPKGGKYFGKLTVISKPTEAELKAELTRLKISLPQ